MNLQALAAAVILALAVGFGGGYYTKGKFDVAAEVTQERKDIKQTAGNVVESMKQGAALEADVASDGVHIDQFKDAAAARVAKYQPKPEPHHAASSNSGVLDGLHGQPANNQPEAAAAAVGQVDCPGGGLVLDVGTVRLLNAARQGTSVGAAGGSDGQKPAAPNPGR